MEELYLDGVLVDLKPNIVSFTQQINNIAELKDRQVGYSNSIKLFYTPTNLQALAFLGVGGNTSRKPYEKINVKHVVDGVEVITNGVGTIKKNTKYFTLVIYDATKDFFSDIKGLKLSDLDFTALNHTATIQTLISSQSNTSGYIYAFGNFWHGSDRTMVLTVFSPSIFVYTLIDMIITQAGYTYSGAIFADADYKSRVYPMTKGVEKVINENIVNLTTEDWTSGTGTPQNFNESLGVSPSPPVQGATHLLHSETITADAWIRLDFGTLDLSVTFGSDFEIGVDWDDGGGINWVAVTILDDPNETPFQSEIFNTDVVKIYIRGWSTWDGANQRIVFSTDFIFKIDTYSEAVDVTFENEIGDVTQSDFLKDVMQRFGLISRRKRNSTEYEFLQMKALLVDKTNAVDMSDQYSDFIGEQYTPKYGQTNYFKHKYEKNVDLDDQDESVQTWADGEMPVANENLKTEKTVLTSIHLASNVTQTRADFGNGEYSVIFDKALLIWNWEYKLETNGDPYSFYYQPKTNKSRIFKLEDKSHETRIQAQWLGVAFYQSFDTYKFLTFDTLDYQTELDNNYVEINAMLDDYKAMTVYMDWSILDYYFLDMFKLVYLKQFGRYYYLNKVSNFRKDRKTKVELIEI